jgi:hypothetical protein
MQYAPVSSLPVIVITKEIAMEFNEALLNEIVLLRQTLERIATSLEDIDDTLEIMFLEDDYDDEDMEDLELLDSDADDIEFGGENEEVDAD